ncbi:MAG: hypothetical protein ACPGXX_10835, partial [Planctomycetaceae bacterium]
HMACLLRGTVWHRRIVERPAWRVTAAAAFRVNRWAASGDLTETWGNQERLRHGKGGWGEFID